MEDYNQEAPLTFSANTATCQLIATLDDDLIEDTELLIISVTRAIEDVMDVMFVRSEIAGYIVDTDGMIS